MGSEKSHILLTKVLGESFCKLSGPSYQEMFDRTGWREFRRRMEAKFDLFEFTSEQKVRWLVARLTRRVKEKWAKILRRDEEGKVLHIGYSKILIYLSAVKLMALATTSEKNDNNKQYLSRPLISLNLKFLQKSGRDIPLVLVSV